MSNSLALINRVIAEHKNISRHVKLVGDSVPDREALAALEKAYGDFAPDQMKALSEKLVKLQQSLSALDEGLKNHFAFEEEILPSLLGELLMRWLSIEHDEIKSKINEAKSEAATTRLEGLNRDELLFKGFNLQKIIDNMGWLIEEHASKEETLLGMIKKALESPKYRG